MGMVMSFGTAESHVTPDLAYPASYDSDQNIKVVLRVHGAGKLTEDDAMGLSQAIMAKASECRTLNAAREKEES